MQTRSEQIARLVGEEWDVLIVGGGISGAGVLREATRRGWRAALIEQRDFAWGTSSRSSKLVHGGLRYLKEGQFKLTLHSVQERDRLMDEAPELVEAQSFLFANCTGRKPGRHMFMLGLKIYDHMARGRHKSAYHDVQATRMLAPGIAPLNLVGAITYIDAKTDDARLVMRVLAEAQAEGGLALNYVAAASPIFNENRVGGLNVVDVETGDHNAQTHAIKARCVINATGAWADNLRGALAGKPMIRPLRGSHLVIPFWRLPVAQAISVIHPVDGRPVFFYPWEGVTIVGTTDLDHTGDLQIEACITKDEVAYLLAAVADQFPSLAIAISDVVATYAGVRPVIDDGKDDPSSAGRDHVVLDESGMVTLTGGKLTTFRLMAQDALRLAAPHVGKAFAIADERLFAPAVALNPRWPAAVCHRLAARYGARAAEFSVPHAAENFDTVPGTTTLWLELAIAAQRESVVHLDDLLLRRTRLGILLPRGGLDYADGIRQICQPLLRWTDNKWDEELVRYTSIIATHYGVPQ